ncbi:hypothetical protein BDF21DRAFT_73808 [Thamnidium elegans]|nr:hypothetical protein BDF21DRAFT_73808 [Thamnidium elegans]
MHELILYFLFNLRRFEPTLNCLQQCALKEKNNLLIHIRLMSSRLYLYIPSSNSVLLQCE